MCADLGGCAVLAVGLPQLLFWDCWFEFRRGHGGLCLVKVMYCQVEVSGYSITESLSNVVCLYMTAKH